MKTYTTPKLEITSWETAEDIVTLSYGTSNDNNYGDIDWE